MGNMTLLLTASGLVLSFWSVWVPLRTTYKRLIERLEKRRLSMQVAFREELAEGFFRVRLKGMQGRRLPGFRPGQHILVHLPSNPALFRAYSLAAWQKSPDYYELAIKCEPDGRVSPRLHKELTPGNLVRISRARGHFPFHARKTTVLVAGGVGITPLRSMLHLAVSRKFSASCTLWHAARFEDQLLYRNEFEALSAGYPAFRYNPILSRPDPSWSGRFGRLTAGDIFQGHQAHYYLCAADAMTTDLVEGLKALGVRDEHLHWESFGGNTATAGVASQLIRTTLGQVLEFSGQPSLLHALEDAGISVTAECRSGECGKCRVKIVDGQIVSCRMHRAKVRDGEALACCIQPQSELLVEVQ